VIGCDPSTAPLASTRPDRSAGSSLHRPLVQPRADVGGKIRLVIRPFPPRLGGGRVRGRCGVVGRCGLLAAYRGSTCPPHGSRAAGSWLSPRLEQTDVNNPNPDWGGAPPTSDAEGAIDSRKRECRRVESSCGVFLPSRWLLRGAFSGKEPGGPAHSWPAFPLLHPRAHRSCTLVYLGICPISFHFYLFPTRDPARSAFRGSLTFPSFFGVLHFSVSLSFSLSSYSCEGPWLSNHGAGSFGVRPPSLRPPAPALFMFCCRASRYCRIHQEPPPPGRPDVSRTIIIAANRRRSKETRVGTKLAPSPAW